MCIDPDLLAGCFSRGWILSGNLHQLNSASLGFTSSHSTQIDFFSLFSPRQRTTVSGPLTSTVDVPGRRALRSAGTNRLVVHLVRLATVGSRAFPVAAAHTWNSLPEHIVSASTLQSFKRHLKHSYCSNPSV